MFGREACARAYAVLQLEDAPGSVPDTMEASSYNAVDAHAKKFALLCAMSVSETLRCNAMSNPPSSQTIPSCRGAVLRCVHSSLRNERAAFIASERGAP